jgi:multiple sugar transport system permease protein
MWDKGKRFALQKLVLSLLAICCLLPTAFLLWRAVVVGGQFTLAQFEEILLYTWRFYVWLWNSIGYAAAILAINLPVSILAAYGFSQHQFPGKKPLFFLYILLMLMPFQATVVPEYLTLDKLGLLDTRWAVILPNALGAFGVFLLTQFMSGVDPELLQAARLDGVSKWGELRYILLPLCRPAIASLAVLQLISSWALIDQPLLFLRSEELLPLSLELGSQTFGAAAFAAGVLFALPPVLVCLLFRGKLEQGICLGNVK